jgi:hypothetical protein
LPYYPFIEVLKKFCRIGETDDEAAYREKLKDSIIGLDPAFEASLPFLEDLLSLKVEDKAPLENHRCCQKCPHQTEPAKAIDSRH